LQPNAGLAGHSNRRGRRPIIPSDFDYVAPTTVDEAVAALANAGEDAKVIAGGQSLMPVLRLRLAAPTMLVDLGRIDELRGVRDDGDALTIGAMTTYYGLLGNPLISKHALLLADATRTVADVVAAAGDGGEHLIADEQCRRREQRVQRKCEAGAPWHAAPDRIGCTHGRSLH